MDRHADGGHSLYIDGFPCLRGCGIRISQPQNGENAKDKTRQHSTAHLLVPHFISLAQPFKKPAAHSQGVAMMVKAGFTAPLETKKLPSTT
jgi:hypothetical protein